MDLVKSQLDCVNDDHKIWDSMGGEVDIFINKKYNIKFDTSVPAL